MKDQPAIGNTVSDETGQFDARFILWRKFCTERGIAVETLPGDLTGDAKVQWEKLKEEEFGATRKPQRPESG